MTNRYFQPFRRDFSTNYYVPDEIPTPNFEAFGAVLAGQQQKFDTFKTLSDINVDALQVDEALRDNELEQIKQTVDGVTQMFADSPDNISKANRALKEASTSIARNVATGNLAKIAANKKAVATRIAEADKLRSEGKLQNREAYWAYVNRGLEQYNTLNDNGVGGLAAGKSLNFGKPADIPDYNKEITEFIKLQPKVKNSLTTTELGQVDGINIARTLTEKGWTNKEIQKLQNDVDSLVARRAKESGHLELFQQFTRAKTDFNTHRTGLKDNIDTNLTTQNEGLTEATNLKANLQNLADTDIKGLQKALNDNFNAGLDVDNADGPRTRAALEDAISKLDEGIEAINTNIGTLNDRTKKLSTLSDNDIINNLTTEHFSNISKPFVESLRSFETSETIKSLGKTFKRTIAEKSFDKKSTSKSEKRPDHSIFGKVTEVHDGEIESTDTIIGRFKDLFAPGGAAKTDGKIINTKMDSFAGNFIEALKASGDPKFKEKIKEFEESKSNSRYTSKQQDELIAYFEDTVNNTRSVAAAHIPLSEAGIEEAEKALIGPGNVFIMPPGGTIFDEDGKVVSDGNILQGAKIKIQARSGFNTPSRVDGKFKLPDYLVSTVNEEGVQTNLHVRIENSKTKEYKKPIEKALDMVYADPTKSNYFEPQSITVDGVKYKIQVEHDRQNNAFMPVFITSDGKIPFADFANLMLDKSIQAQKTININ